MKVLSETLDQPVRFDRSAFTLIELLVAMAVLSIIMVMLLGIVTTAQSNWTNQEGRTRIMQNSRVVFDMLDSDFRSLTTSNVEGQEIGLHVFDHNPSDSSKRSVITFVATIEPHEYATSRMCEVMYRFHTDSNDSTNQYLLQRAIISNKKNATDDDKDWNFFNLPADWQLNDIEPETALSTPRFETIVAGVQDFRIEIVDSQGNQMDNGGFDSGKNGNYPNGNYTRQPNRVIIHLSLFDESLMDDSLAQVRLRTKRSFTKIIYLGNISK